MTELPAAYLVAANGLLVLWLIAGLIGYGRLLSGLRSGKNGQVATDRIGTGEWVLALGLTGWFLLFALGEIALRTTSAPAPAMPTEFPREAIWFNLLLTLALMGILLGVLKGRGHSVRLFLGLGTRPLGATLIQAAGWLLLAYPLVGAGMMVVVLLTGQQPVPQPVLQFFLNADGPGDRFLLAFMAVIVAPVFEEVVFRGFLYRVFKRYAGAVAGALLSGLLFSLVHVYLPALLAFIVLAVCLTLVYEKTGSLWLPIGMHMLFNSVTLAVALLAPGELPTAP